MTMKCTTRESKMIKIEKILVNGKLLGREDDDWYYLYKGLDTETNMFCEFIAKQNEVEMSPTFDKEIRKRIRIRLKKEIK